MAGGDYFFFRTKRGDYSSKVIISNIVHWNSCPKYFVLFIFPLNQKIITSNTLSMGFLRVPKLVPWLVFRAWSVSYQYYSLICWISLALQLNREGIKGRKDGQRGDYSRGDYFKYFRQKGGGGVGGGWGGAAIIWGNTVFRVFEDHARTFYTYVTFATSHHAWKKNTSTQISRKHNLHKWSHWSQV